MYVRGMSSHGDIPFLLEAKLAEMASLLADGDIG
jgi:hypothetical protein